MRTRLTPRLHLAVVAAGLLAHGGPAVATQADLDREVDQLIADFQAKSTPINLLVRRIKWTGISDARLFDPMEAELLRAYEKETSFDGVQYNAWLVQALAFSGQEKYRPTLERVLNGKVPGKLHRHTETSLRVLPDFARWNPVISRGVAEVPAESIHRQRVVNMLEGEDPELARAGAAVVYSEFLKDPAMLDIVVQQLLARYPAGATNPEAAEACAWFAKILGESGDPRFVPALTQVKANTSQPAILRHTEKALRQLDQH